MKSARACEGLARAQRAVRKKTEVAFAEQRGHVGAVLLRHLFGVAEGEEVLNVRAVEERRAAALAVERGRERRGEAAGPRRLGVEGRGGLAREHGGPAEQFAQLFHGDGGGEPFVAEARGEVEAVGGE